MKPPSPWDFGWTQVFTIIGFTITLVIAFGGFRTFGRWKREKLEERKIEVAFDMLAFAYEAGFVFASIRGPMSYDYEWEDMPEVPHETADQRRHRGTFYATLKRINLSKDFFERAWKLQPRCMAVLGPAVEDTFMLMHRARREVEVAAQMLGSAGRRNLGHELSSQLERDVWDIGSAELEKDRVGQKLREFRLRTEDICKPVIEGQMRSIRLPHWMRRNKKSTTGVGASQN